MKNLTLKSMLIGVAVLTIASADMVFAGGGGSKADPKIKICNESDVEVGVMADAAAFINSGDTSEENFLAMGGVILNPGHCHCFKVKAGEVVVLATLGEGEPFDTLELTVAKKDCVNLVVTVDEEDCPVIGQ